MGIATLLVTFFHMYLDWNEVFRSNFLVELITFLQKRCNVGVDIFLFMSGIGLYFSLKKNKISTFYKNRFLRIVPAFIIVVIIYYLYLGDNTTMFRVLSLTSLIWDGNRYFWYIQLILILYLIFPFIYNIIKKYDFLGLFVMLFLVIILTTMYGFVDYVGYTKIEIALTRMPVFLIGTFMGKMIDNKKSIPKRNIYYSLVISILVLLLIFFWFYKFKFMFVQRYLYCILAICLVICMAYMYTFIKNKNNIIMKIVCFFGKYSLEMYLLYEALNYIFIDKLGYLPKLHIYLITFILAILLSLILKKIVNILFRIFLKFINLFKKNLDK